MVAKQQFNVYLDPTLVKRIKHQAIDEGASLSDVVARALQQYLDHQVLAQDQGGEIV
ncbi:MAG: CopG family transcriptional regulator [Actinomycetaceae bacterium]|nr:CopG family transcriptional regulator [Actinomycetaceae bacterium]